MSISTHPTLSMIILMQHDLDAAVAFYEKIGFSCTFHIPQQWAEMTDGRINLGLAHTLEELPLRRTGLVFNIANLQEWCSLVEGQGIHCSDTLEQVHGIMSSITDPGNNILELYQPTPEKLQKALEEEKNSN